MASQAEQTVTTETMQGSDAGTNAPVRYLLQTQAPTYTDPGITDTGIPQPSIFDPAQTGADTADPGYITTAPGAGSPDDATGGNSAVQAIAASGQNVTITPRPNILDDYPSYTWQASVYMLSPEQLKSFTDNPRQKINNYNLLFQSGGAANSSGAIQGPAGGTAAALSVVNTEGRNPFFNEDFYIDNISFKSIAMGKGTGTAHSTVELKFQVTEPNNISLLDRLYLAAQDLSPVDGTSINYMAVSYLMIIRFYALGQDGKIMQVGQKQSIDSQTGDRYAIVEKYIPFNTNNIEFNITSNLVTYDWTGTAIGTSVGLTTRRGTIPFDVELTGSTIDEVLSGDIQYSAATPPANTPGASTTAYNTEDPELRRAQNQSGVTPPPPPKATKSALTQGLVTAMNDQQARYVRNNEREHPDVYKIQYSPEAEALIKGATIQKPSSKVSQRSTASGAAVSQDTQTASPDKQAMVTTSRNIPVTAGMQMVQAIELIIRNSNFITDQADLVFDEKTNLPKPNPKAKNNTKGVKWFNIIPSATKRSDQYDHKINDYAYEITYTISTYEIKQIDSPFFPPPKFNGVHKKYNYWFTGENIAVLEYKESYNSQYQLNMTGGAIKLKQVTTSSMRDMPFITISARSGESSQGALGRANELNANGAESIYNPADLATGKIRILGDPAWIMQGSVIGVTSPNQFGPTPFNDDGSLNFDTQDILFEIAWQKPEDYSLSTGLADPYGRTSKGDPGKRQPLQSRIYRCIDVLSEFRGGMFEQTIEGSLMTYAVPNGTNRAPGTAQPSTTIGSDTGGSTTGPLSNDEDGEGGAPQQNSENDDSPDADTNLGVRQNAAPPTLINTVSSGALISPSSTNFLNSALFQNTAGGTTGLKIPTIPNLSIGSIGTGFFPTFGTIPADLLQPALSIQLAVTSNGVSAGQPNLQSVQAALNDPQAMVRET